MVRRLNDQDVGKGGMVSECLAVSCEKLLLELIVQALGFAEEQQNRATPPQSPKKRWRKMRIRIVLDNPIRRIPSACRLHADSSHEGFEERSARK